MSNTFIVSDTHFSHTNSFAKFKNSDGNPLRPFTSNEEMDDTLISNWNSVVKPTDKVYHLGDVVINKRALQLVQKLNGIKRLIRGNHDVFKTTEYIAVGFGEIYGVRVLADMILSHIPLAKPCITPRFHRSVHGHLHSNVINDPTYLNVSVEQIDFTPISIENVRLRLKQNDEYFKNTGHVFNWALGRLHQDSDDISSSGAN